jgi:hypothetical protein
MDSLNLNNKKIKNINLLKLIKNLIILIDFIYLQISISIYNI